MITFGNLILLLGIFQVAIWTFKVFTLFKRIIFSTPCTPQRYGENSWAVIAGIDNEFGKQAAF